MIFFDKTMKFVVPAVSALVCSAVLAACGSDSSIKAPEEQSFNTFDDLPNCTKNREGETAFVEEDGLRYVCQEKKWTEMPDTLTEYNTEDDLPSCGSKANGVKAYVKEVKTIFVCSDKSWNPYAVVYDTEDDLPNCTKKRDGEIAKLKDEDSFVICKEGAWAEHQEETKKGNEGVSSASGSKEEDPTDTSSESGSKGENSSSSEFQWEEGGEISSASKTVKFEEGVLWKPSYGERVRGFNSDADEKTFWDDPTTNDWWHIYSDAGSSGKSTGSIEVGSDYATIKTAMVYANWTKGESGMNVANPSPYVSTSFNFAPKGYVDISGEKGVCIVYTSERDIRIEFVSKGKTSDTYDYWDVWAPASQTKKTARLKFANLPATWWQENASTLSQALKQMAAMAIVSPYRNQTHCYEVDPSNCNTVTEKNTIKLYMIGEYEKCPENDDIELGGKVVEFEKDILWEPGYGEKARTFFGDVDEYNFYTGDPSGWWYTYTDKESGGESVSEISYQASYLQAKLTNKDAGLGWADAAFGFELTNGYDVNGFVDLTVSFGKGICLEYSSGYDFDFKLHSNIIADQFWYRIPASAARTVIDIDFNDYTDYDWQENEGSLKNMLKKASSFHFEFAPRHTDGYEYKTNTVKLYKLGKYGACK